MSSSIRSESPPKCNHCKEVAKTFCKGCENDPVAEGKDTKTWYCGANCQKANWELHKPTCRGIQARKDVYRIGHLLQHVFYTFRETVFDGLIDKIEEKDGKLEIQFITDEKSKFKACYKNLPCTFPFPTEKFKDLKLEDKFGVLTHLACDDAVADTQDLAQYLLNGNVFHK